MRMVTCPFCQEKGRIPDSFIGKRIKCGKCDNRFLVTPPPPKGAAAAAAAPTPANAALAPAAGPPVAVRGGHEIAIEGMDEQSWQAANINVTVAEAEQGHDPEAKGVFTAAPPSDHAADLKEYKLLTQKDKWFEGKFDLSRLEEAINFYAHQGWKVKTMTPAQVKGFTGGIQEELVVLLER
ncbi:MAG TPA: DUF4177 domain-containing protein [Isosphaeraceae bacterium]|jgi:hypothetical protein|nr:DUF4177 domain-containing protein [Isosphaeraceae bacterium]